MVILQGPYCLVCCGKNVERRKVWDIVSWGTSGVTYGWVDKDICLDCEESDNVAKAL